MDILFTSAWWVVACLAVVAGIARGLAGFGIGLIMMPVGAALLTPQIMVPVLTAIDAPVALLLIWSAWREFDRRNVFTLILSAVVCLPVGVYLLTVVDAVTLSLFVNVSVLLVAIALMSGFVIRGRASTARDVGIGGLSGVLHGSVSLPGPPIILGWVATQTPGPKLRANIIVYFMFIDVLVIPVHWTAGLFTEPALWLAASLAPIYFAATMVGKGLFGKVPEKWFQRLVLSLVMIGAVGGLITTLV